MSSSIPPVNPDNSGLDYPVTTPTPVPSTAHRAYGSPVMATPPVRQSRDRAQYVRNQKGHSLTLWLLFGGFLLWIPAIYFSLSPNHYWHA